MQHRRRNPALSDVNSLLTLGVVIGGGYLFIQYVLPLLQGIGTGAQAAATAVNKAANAIAAPIANAYVAMTSGPGAQVQGSAILSTGEEVPMQDIAATGGLMPVPGNPAAFYFTYNSQTYVISGPRDANGNYAATLAPYGVLTSGW